MAWQVQSIIHTGGRKQQQDRTIILRKRFGREILIALGDGMGGHAHGAAAAQTLINTAEQHFPPPRKQPIPEFLQNLCLKAHEAIREIPWDGKGARPGSTCVLLYLGPKHAHWLHVGDSRLYLFQGEELIFQTEDHTLAALKTSQNKTGQEKTVITPSDHRLYRCLGGNHAPQPSAGVTRIEKDHWFLLCSDGFWHSVLPQEMAKVVKNSPNLFAAAQQLVELAVLRSGEESDNASVVLARQEFGSPLRRLRRIWR